MMEASAPVKTRSHTYEQEEEEYQYMEEEVTDSEGESDEGDSEDEYQEVLTLFPELCNYAQIKLLIYYYIYLCTSVAVCLYFMSVFSLEA